RTRLGVSSVRGQVGLVSQARIIVIGNEKGGAGKSTVAVHLATGLLHEQARVGVLDLDQRRQSTGRFFSNRATWGAASAVALPGPIRFDPNPDLRSLDRTLAEATEACDFLIVDTPGADTELSRLAHQRADLIVTPMNDSFVDFDVLGVIDPVSLDLVRPSHYAETVWDARKARAAARARSIDWVVLRNRLSSVEPRNRKRVDERVNA